MSLPRRVVYDSVAMAPPSLYEDSTPDSVLFDVDMSSILGAFHQIRYVSSYIVETFDHIIQLAEDTNERIESVSQRSSALYSKLHTFESRIMSIEVNERGHNGGIARLKYLSQRETYPPTVLSRATNTTQIMAQYEAIQPLPPFWKLIPVTQQDTTAFYSNPGFFFQEWLKQEQKRQMNIKLEQKKQKQIRKAMKAEKKKMKKLLKDQLSRQPLPEDRQSSRPFQYEESKQDIGFGLENNAIEIPRNDSRMSVSTTMSVKLKDEADRIIKPKALGMKLFKKLMPKAIKKDDTIDEDEENEVRSVMEEIESVRLSDTSARDRSNTKTKLKEPESPIKQPMQSLPTMNQSTPPPPPLRKPPPPPPNQPPAPPRPDSSLLPEADVIAIPTKGHIKQNYRLNASNISSQKPPPQRKNEGLSIDTNQGGKKLLNSLFKSLEEQSLGANSGQPQSVKQDTMNPPPPSTVRDNIKRVSRIISADSKIDNVNIADYLFDPLVRDNPRRNSKAFFDYDSILLPQSTGPADKPPKTTLALSKRVISRRLSRGNMDTVTSASSKGSVEPDSPPPESDEDDLPPPDDDEPSSPPPDSPMKPPIPVSPLFSVLSDIREGVMPLRKVEVVIKPKLDVRDQMLTAIKGGVVSLKKAEPILKPKEANQNVAIAAILANRSKIAGSDSESDSDSDTEFSDDDYG